MPAKLKSKPKSKPKPESNDAENPSSIVRVKTLQDLLEHVEKCCGTRDNILFRGQQQDWALVPKLARINMRNHGRYDAEVKMFKEFKRRAGALILEKPNTDIEWLAVAQHHGMATRLLDWSTSPLVALWFAVCIPPAKDETGKVLDGVLWMLEPDDADYLTTTSKKNVFEIGRTSVFEPSHLIPRIAAQNGCFTVHGFVENGSRFVPMQRLPRLEVKLTKFIISGDSFAGLRSSLDRCGINAASLFPDIDGISRDIVWKFSILDDEI